MFSFKELLFVGVTGGIIYGAIEVLFRGYTHWSMILTGGLCFLLFYILNFMLNINILGKCILASFIITSFELIIGYIVNVVHGMNVWSYANMPFNYMGQICLLYSGIWFFFGIPMSILAGYIRTII